MALEDWSDLSAWWDQSEAEGLELRVAWERLEGKVFSKKGWERTAASVRWERMVAPDLMVLLDSEGWTAHRLKEP